MERERRGGETSLGWSFICLLVSDSWRLWRTSCEYKVGFRLHSLSPPELSSELQRPALPNPDTVPTSSSVGSGCQCSPSIPNCCQIWNQDPFWPCTCLSMNKNCYGRRTRWLLLFRFPHFAVALHLLTRNPHPPPHPQLNPWWMLFVLDQKWTYILITSVS